MGNTWIQISRQNTTYMWAFYTNKRRAYIDNWRKGLTEDYYSNAIYEFDIKSNNIKEIKQTLNKDICFIESRFVSMYNIGYGLFSSKNSFIKFN